jgi:hypothetical protein
MGSRGPRLFDSVRDDNFGYGRLSHGWMRRLGSARVNRFPPSRGSFGVGRCRADAKLADAYGCRPSTSTALTQKAAGG